VVIPKPILGLIAGDRLDPGIHSSHNRCIRTSWHLLG